MQPIKVLALCLIMALGGFSLSGCASNPPPTSSRTQQEIKGDSDRYFEKMKQEERDQNKDTGQSAR